MFGDFLQQFGSKFSTLQSADLQGGLLALNLPPFPGSVSGHRAPTYGRAGR